MYIEAARTLGRLLGERGHVLVYGGGRLGLMGVLAQAAQAAGGLVIGVIPQALVAREQAYWPADDLRLVATAAERQAAMEALSEGYLALPGGFGTLAEIGDALTLGVSGGPSRPLALVNIAGYYDPLLRFFEQFYRLGFADPSWRTRYGVFATPDEALDYLERRRGKVA